MTESDRISDGLQAVGRTLAGLDARTSALGGGTGEVVSRSGGLSAAFQAVGEYAGGLEGRIAALESASPGEGWDVWLKRMCDGATTYRNRFMGWSRLETIPLLDTSQSTEFDSMFQNCTSLTTIPMLDTSQGETFYMMFQNCTSLTTIPALDTSQGTDLSSMFWNCTSLVSIPALDLSQVQSWGMANMVDGCASLTRIQAHGARYSIDLTGAPLLSAGALDEFFGGLGTPDGDQAVIITGCAGAAACDQSIATGNGWTVIA